MKLWVDDIREPPGEEWHWALDSASAIGLLEACLFTEVSLDHDLGGEDTTRPVVMWMIENEVYPETIRVHSANPVAREWLEGMIQRYLEVVE